MVSSFAFSFAFNYLTLNNENICENICKLSSSYFLQNWFLVIELGENLEILNQLHPVS